MPSCSVCTSPAKAEIDAALVAGQSKRTVAARFGVTDAAVQRHKARHLSEKLKKTEADEVRTLADLVARGHREVDKILARPNEDGKRDGMVLQALDRMIKLGELQYGGKFQIRVGDVVDASTLGEAELDMVIALQLRLRAEEQERESEALRRAQTPRLPPGGRP